MHIPDSPQPDRYGEPWLHLLSYHIALTLGIDNHLDVGCAVALTSSVLFYIYLTFILPNKKSLKLFTVLRILFKYLKLGNAQVNAFGITSPRHSCLFWGKEKEPPQGWSLYVINFE